MLSGEFALEFLRDGELALSDVTIEGGEYGNGGSSGTPSFTLEAEDGVVQAGLC